MENDDACERCGNVGVGAWLTLCPFCGVERQPSITLDDEGFACDATTGTRILDEHHPVLAWGRRYEWQCFVVSRHGKTGHVRGLRRTCVEWNDNPNKAWSRTRRRVRGVPAEKAYGATVRDCVEMIRSSLFHVWSTVPQKFPGQCESDYYVNLGLIAPTWQTTDYEDIGPGFYVMERDTFEFVADKLKTLRSSGDPRAKVVYDFVFGGDLEWFRAGGKERLDDYGQRLADRDTVSLMALAPRELDTFLEHFDQMIDIL